jgi:hypothetical protein
MITTIFAGIGFIVVCFILSDYLNAKANTGNDNIMPTRRTPRVEAVEPKVSYTHKEVVEVIKELRVMIKVSPNDWVIRKEIGAAYYLLYLHTSRDNYTLQKMSLRASIRHLNESLELQPDRIVQDYKEKVEATLNQL